MPSYRAPLDDIRFLLDHVIGVDQLATLPGHEDATPEMIHTVLAEGARFCEEVLAPINQTGDAEGCIYHEGSVTTPAGFREAYRAYCDGGWPGMVAPAAFGGQDLPRLMRIVLDEMMCAANLSFSMYELLSHGVTGALERWGSDALKARFLPRMVDGSWTGTMCLTEANAGTDLGLIRTRAVPAANGHFRLTGTKIFISAGEHDLTENIVHLVLAKLPDAPAGTRGISLFLVPKRIVQEDGSCGEANGVRCSSIEHKMGIRANATCVLDFDDAEGFLIGEPHKGMRAMFTMMNSARLNVGMQGIGLAEVSYQNALAYARDRRQGRASGGGADTGAEADPILVHPDVRRMLMTMKAYTEGLRALAVWVGLQLDLEARHPDAGARAAAADVLALMTPVIKAFGTDTAFEVTNLALQCFGGYGYIRETGMEQFVRDARITQIYEGTNGVQAMDLLGRKVPEDDGRLVRHFLGLVHADLAAAVAVPAIAALAARVEQAAQALASTTKQVLTRAQTNPDEIGAAASDYLRLFGLVATGWMWIRIAMAAVRTEAGAPQRTIEKLGTARFFVERLLPTVHALAAQISAGAEPIMAVDLS